MTNRPHIGSAAVVWDDEKILLGRRAKNPNFGKWVMPGGKVEAGESLDDAARREVLEETGLEVEITERLGIFEIIEPDEHSVFVLSLAKVTGGSLQAASDLTAARWVPVDSLGDVALSKPCRAALEQTGFIQ